MTVDEIVARLKAHDHYFEWSDECRSAGAGYDDRREIIKELRKLSMRQVHALLIAHVPTDCYLSWVWALTFAD